MHKCECPFNSTGAARIEEYLPEELKARIHAPNDCLGDYDMRLYRRGKEQLWLCSCCCLWGDIEIETVQSN